MMQPDEILRYLEISETDSGGPEVVNFKATRPHKKS